MKMWLLSYDLTKALSRKLGEARAALYELENNGGYTCEQYQEAVNLVKALERAVEQAEDIEDVIDNTWEAEG